MALVPSFLALLQPFAGLMSAPTFGNFVTLLTGWVFAERRNVTGLIEAAGAVGSTAPSPNWPWDWPSASRAASQAAASTLWPTPLTAAKAYSASCPRAST